MSIYYLMSQLPALDGIGDTTPIPITEERFLELCSRYLGDIMLRELKELTLSPSVEIKATSSPLIDKWNEGEKNLRIALARHRADKLGKSFNLKEDSISSELITAVKAAIEAENPLNAEMILSHYRLSFLEALRPIDSFTKDSVFYYAIKLKLLLRIRQFDKEKGIAAYKNIYNSIINRDNQEATQ